MRLTLAALREHIDEATIWGGDWNQAFEGRDYVGTLAGRKEILELIELMGLSVPTKTLTSAVPGHRSIDHIAFPKAWDVSGVHRLAAAVEGSRLSDHDAYVVAADPPCGAAAASHDPSD
jgi:endonuclease/exonuclease/phosphatase family metal-dependent hydrolase